MTTATGTEVAGVEIETIIVTGNKMTVKLKFQNGVSNGKITLI